MIDIKGKKFPYKGKNYWENWISKEDGKFLKKWSDFFGNNSIGILVFVYKIEYEKDEKYFKDIHVFKRNRYGLAAIEINKYLKNSKLRSKSFNAIYVSREKISNLLKPISYFLE